MTNQAPCKRHCIRCCLTNSYDSLYNFARKFLIHSENQKKEAHAEIGKGEQNWGNQPQPRKRHKRVYSPNRNLIQQIILHLQLLHLSIPHGSILASKEIMFDFVPGSSTLVTQRDFDSIELLWDGDGEKIKAKGCLKGDQQVAV